MNHIQLDIFKSGGGINCHFAIQRTNYGSETVILLYMTDYREEIYSKSALVAKKIRIFLNALSLPRNSWNSNDRLIESPIHTVFRNLETAVKITFM